MAPTDRFSAQADDYFALLNLVHGYADAIDNGDFDRLSQMFLHADVYMPGSTELDVTRGSGRFGQFLSDALRVYPPRNTPRTRHVTTNHQITFEGRTDARIQSYYTVMQETSAGGLQPIIIGTYLDRFALIDDEWCFVERRETATAIGDMTNHVRAGLNIPLDR